MAFQRERITQITARHCMRHGCKEPVTWRVATTKWWAMHDKDANDGMTGIVFECCEEHVGVGWKIRPDVDAEHKAAVATMYRSIR